MSKESVVASITNAGLKNFIIGKMWVNNVNGTRPGAIRISQNLPADITIKAGTTLFLNNNKKREGKIDADYSVSILLPAKIADQLIEAGRNIALSAANAVA